MSFAINSGSRAEKPTEKGSAHFLKTSLFSETAKRSGLRLIRDFETRGIQFSSSSDREKLTVTLKGRKHDAEFAFKALTEMFFSPDTKTYNVFYFVDAFMIFSSKPTKSVLL